MHTTTTPHFLFFILSSLLFSSFFNIAISFQSETGSSQSETEDETPFSYIEDTGTGPESWGLINPDWQVCDNGEMQSPIDLLDAKVQVLPNLGKLKRDYKPAPAVVKNRGHDITVIWKGFAGQININGTYFKLKQCHWHSPAEHTFNGSRYNLELHIVHSSSDEKIAVIGITYKYGRPDPFLTRVLRHINSLPVGEEKELEVVNPGDIKFGSRKYYRYIGSLTVPPCTEGVIWTISEKVRTVTREQVRALRMAVHDGFEANARPTQGVNEERTVLFYKPSANGEGGSS